MQRFAAILALLLAASAVTAMGEAKSDTGTAARVLSDVTDLVMIETSDEVNETATEEEQPEPEEQPELEPTDKPNDEADKADSVIVGGSLEIVTADPQFFCDDSIAQTSLKTAIATAAQAEVSDVTTRCRMARRLAVDEAPQRRLAGSVIIEYTVTTTSALVDYLQYLDEDAWAQAINQALADSGSDLSITVTRVTVPSVQDTAELPDLPEDEIAEDSACGATFTGVSLLSLLVAFMP